MSIYTGCNFKFAGLASESFDLMIASIDGSIGDSFSTGKDFEIIEDRVPGSYKGYDYGIELNAHLEFPLTFAKKHEGVLNMHDRRRISTWLFGRKKYKKFIIYRPDAQDVIFYCRLNFSEWVTVGGKCIGATFTVICDSAFGYTDEKTYIYNITSHNQVESFYNLSEHEGYHRPEYMEIQLQNNATGITIINLSDNNYTFQFTGLQANETLRIDNHRKLITRSSGLLALDRFNLNFLQFVNGNNRLQFIGNSKVTIKTEFTVEVGG